jgi:hypothetical protein
LIVCGVEPVSTSNCTAPQPFVNVTVTVPAWLKVNGTTLNSSCGHASPLFGMA